MRTAPRSVNLAVSLFAGVMLSGAVASISHAQAIHKCVKADGAVSYQQDECPSDAPGKAIAVRDNGAGGGTLTLPPNGNHQYFTTLTVNGVTVTGIVDTGATYVTVSPDLATRMHINPAGAKGRVMQTANGMVMVATQTVPVAKIGKFELYNVEFAVAPNSPTLIGMTALSQLTIVNENGSLVLNRR